MMTTTTMPGVSETPSHSDHNRFIDLLGSEWTKLITVRSTVWTLLATAVVGIGLGAIVTSAQASRWSSRSLVARAAFDPTRSSLAGLLFRNWPSACSAYLSSVRSTAQAPSERHFRQSHVAPWSSWPRSQYSGS